MKTYFTVDSFPGQRFVGTIRQIRNAATTVQNVVTYDAVIDVDNTDLRLRPGMTANVTIIYAERKGAIAIPNTALRFRAPASIAGSGTGATAGSGQGHRPHSGAGPAASGASSAGGAAPAADTPDPKSIWVMRGGSPQQVSVHVGLSDGTVTEVEDGLAEGDQVLVDVEGGEGAAPSSTGRSTLRPMF
jgi:HlyD family secretion protein